MYTSEQTPRTKKENINAINTLTVHRIENGYIFNLPDDTVVIEYKDTEQETIKAMLDEFATWLGYQYDKWGTNNLVITFDGKGHKVED